MWEYGSGWNLRFAFYVLSFFVFFFFSCMRFYFRGQEHCWALFSTVHRLKNIKNKSHDTIHTFKNYFATILSVFSFQF